MLRMTGWLIAALLLMAPTGAQADYVCYPAPAVSYYYAPPATVSYYSPTVSYYSPTVSYYAPAPTVSYYAPAPTVSYYAPTVSYYAAPAYYSPPTATTYRYGLFGRRSVTYYSPGYVYP